MTFNLKDVVPWGRSFDEYCAMFDLSPQDLRGPILGCGDGPASFNSEATRRGTEVVSVDPMYRFSAEELRSRVTETAPVIAAELRKNADEFVWNHFESVDALVAARLEAMETFLADYPHGRRVGRYVDAALPELPFPDRRFRLALCSHLLFLYSEQLDLGFHVAALKELCRVADEVRVFPLLELGSRRSRHLDSATDALRSDGIDTRIVRVKYEFQKGGNEMLVVSKEADRAGRHAGPASGRQVAGALCASTGR